MANFLTQGVDVSNIDRGVMAREQFDAFDRQRKARNALAAWAQDRSDTNLGAVFEADPQTGFQLEKMSLDAATKRREQQFKVAGIIKDMLTQAANSADPAAAWEQARTTLVKQYGMDMKTVSSLPPWGEGTKALYQTVEKFGAPFKGRIPGQTDAGFYQQGDRGTIRHVEGIVPPAEKPQIVKGADGYQYYASGPDKGKRVLGGIKSPRDQFMEMIGGTGPMTGGGGTGFLGGGAGGDTLRIEGIPEGATLSAGTDTAQPRSSMRELFYSLPPAVQQGILAAKDPMQAFSTYMTRAKGLDVQFDENGRVRSITQGGSSTPGGMQKKTAGNIEEKLLTTREGLARLDSIATTYRPEYLTYPEQLENAWVALKEKSGGVLGRVSPEERQRLADYTQFRRDAVDNINRYINEITGAQMSEAEANRLRKGVPDAEKDSPTEFASKWISTSKSLQMAAARYVYALRNGLDVESVSVGQMPQIVNDRGAALEQSIKARNPSMSDQQVQEIVQGQLLIEFGLRGR